MLAFHVKPILSLTGVAGTGASDPADFFRLAMLLASAGVFGLKIADVGWLRVKPGWRSTVGAALIIALLHVNVLERATDTELVGPLGQFHAALAASGLLAVETARRTLQRIRLVPVVPRDDNHYDPPYRWVYARVEEKRPRPVWADVGPLLPRPPPTA